MAGPGPEKAPKQEDALAKWREAREWWNGEPPREITLAIDSQGIRRQTEQLLPPLGSNNGSGQKPIDENHSEEFSIREKAVRDPLSHRPLPVSSDTVDTNRSLQAAKAETAWAVMVRDDGSPSISHQTLKRLDPFGGYAPLHVLSGYAFGRSTILVEEIAGNASYGGCQAAAIADPHSLTGAVEHAKACNKVGIKPLIGASIELPEGGEIVLIARTAQGYVSLSRLITECHLGEPRGFPLGSWERLAAHTEALLCLTGGDIGPVDRLLVRRDYQGARSVVERLIGLYGKQNVFLEVERSHLPWSFAVSTQILDLAQSLGVTAVAGGVVTHARPDHFPAQDTLVSAHTLCLIDEILGRKAPRHPLQPVSTRFPERALNAERFLRTSAEMHDLYSDRPDLLSNTILVAERCDADVLPQRMPLPNLFDNDAQALRDIVELGMYSSYPKVEQKHRQRLKLEVARISRLGFASHFVIAWDLARWAREQSIQMSGRGSVVDSAVAYVLGLSRIDAITHNLHFDRFLPRDGKKHPDIDLDFEARRRDDVRGYLVGKYGVERVGAVAAIGCYGTRGIVREVGKVFGLPNETISFLAKRIHGGVSPEQLESAFQKRPELRDSGIPVERFRWVLALAERLMDVPRNMRLHSSGVVLSKHPIRDTVPMMWSAAPSSEESGQGQDLLRMAQWDKRTMKHFGDKYDLLCLRGQDVMSGLERRVRTSDSDFSAERIDATTDPEVFRAMRSGELIGIPQSASPAMRQAHMRLRTNDLHDTSLVQAGIRPGVGGAVQLNELIARRRGKEFTYDHKDLEAILGITYGIIVFQEQVDQLLQRFGRYSSGEAEDIREAIHKRRREDYGQILHDKMIDRIVSNGYSLTVAEQVFTYVSGFKGYGFAQGHALAFAEISLRCVWMMQNHPAEYFAALLSAQPAGYYGPATIANEARSRGVAILPFDVNASDDRFEVETVYAPGLAIPAGGIRVGLMQVSHLSAPTKTRMLEHRALAAEYAATNVRQPLHAVSRKRQDPPVALLGRGDDAPTQLHLKPYRSIFDFALKVQPATDELEAMILSGAFDSLHPNRRSLLWSLPQIASFAKTAYTPGGHPTLPFDIEEPPLTGGVDDFCAIERSIQERTYLGLDIHHHLVAYERSRVSKRGGITTTEAKRLAPGDTAFVVGNPIRLRFPPTKSGKRVVFFDLEDETGLLNVTCFDETYQRDGRAIVCSQFVTVCGVFQDRDGSPAFLATRVYPYHPKALEHQGPLPLVLGDFLVG
jgi:error-prone DNA polymerase